MKQTKGAIAKRAAHNGWSPAMLKEAMASAGHLLSDSDAEKWIRRGHRYLLRDGPDVEEVSASIMPSSPVEEPKETSEERAARISRQFNTLSRLAKRVVAKKLPSLIVSGPPGLGKSYSVEQELENSNMDYEIVCGTISAIGLYIALYEMRNHVLVLDDCDAVFRDEVALNLLKAALDSSQKRIISWRKLSSYLADNDIPQSFEFKGSVVFATNIDFEKEMQRGSKLAPHFSALVDRSLYLSLTLRSTEDVLTRIHQVWIKEKLYEAHGLSEEQGTMLMTFVEDNAESFYSLSIRTLLQAAACMRDDPENWEEDVRATKLRTL